MVQVLSTDNGNELIKSRARQCGDRSSPYYLSESWGKMNLQKQEQTEQAKFE